MTLISADTEFAARLKAQFSDDIVADTEPRYLEEPRGTWQGRPTLVAKPRNVEEVAGLIRAASEARVPVIPYGGGTGLVGAQISPEGPLPLILSLERMTAVRAVWPEENVLIVEAGVILADVQAAARDAGRLFPLSLAAEGTARIGGNLATNAGGTGVLRYGNTRDLCLGLEAVLPDGQIWHGLRRLRKDNTGYDLRNLLIGSEGTLGVITAAAMKMFPQPHDIGTAVFSVASPAAALTLLSMARERLGDMVSAFELISGQGLAFLRQELPEIRQPFEAAPDWSVLIEVGVAAGMTAQSALEDLFAHGLEKDLVSDGVIAQSAQQSDAFWSVREHIPEANKRIGAVVSSDVSLPLGALADFIKAGPARIAAVGEFRINCFGHMGDGNLHYNIFPVEGRSKKDHLGDRENVQRAIHDLVHEFDGSFSAEHGVGRLKVGDLERYGDPAKLSAMRAIKQALDPLGIMNPGAVLRA